MESKTVYKWPIVNFSRTASRDVPTRRLKSDFFTLNGSNAMFFLRFYPTIKSQKESKEYCSVYLYARDLGGAASIKLDYRFWIENNRGEKIKKKLGYTSCKFLKVNAGNGHTEFVHHDRLYYSQNGFVKDNFIFICCEMRPRFPSTDEQIQEAINMKEWKLFVGGFSDWCTIKVDENEFKIGKSKLMAYSSVFEAMFKSGMEESQTGTITMKDTSPMAVEKMVRYFYIKKIEAIDNDAFELYLLADKYDIQGLKKMSSQILIKILNANNVLDFLNLASNYNDEFLKQEIMDYFTASMSGEEFKELTLSDKWIKLLNEDKQMAREILDQVFNASGWH